MLFSSLACAIIIWALRAQLTFAQSPSATATNAPGSTPICPSLNGLYEDNDYATWNVTCGYQSTSGYFESAGTVGQGIYHCFQGCNLRPQCNSFDFKGSAAVGAGKSCLQFTIYAVLTSHIGGAPSGSGTCYYKSSYGTTNYSSTGYYATGFLVQTNASLICPYYNNTVYTDANGQAWYVGCGYDSNPGSYSSNSGLNMSDCINQCYALGSTCAGLSYVYSSTSTTGSGGNGLCYFKHSPVSLYGSGTLTVNAAYRTTIGSSSTSAAGVATSNAAVAATTSAVANLASSSSVSSASIASSSSVTAASSSTVGASSYTAASSPSSSVSTVVIVTSATSSSSSASSSATTSSGCAAPTAAATCPGSNNTVYTDGCGTSYTVYCGFDTSPGSSSSASATSFSACFPLCDALPNCQSFTYVPGTCYFKTSFSTKYTSSSVNAAVRYVPPNANYIAPQAAGSVNASSGCGSALPAGQVAGASSTSVNFTSPDGYLRNYLIHIPTLYNINTAAPLIFSFHGLSATASQQESLSGFSNDNWNPYGIVIYPNGVNVRKSKAQRTFKTDPCNSKLGKATQVLLVVWTISDLSKPS